MHIKQQDPFPRRRTSGDFPGDFLLAILDLSRRIGAESRPFSHVPLLKTQPGASTVLSYKLDSSGLQSALNCFDGSLL
jgi:hypothetical protein